MHQTLYGNSSAPANEPPFLASFLSGLLTAGIAVAAGILLMLAAILTCLLLLDSLASPCLAADQSQSQGQEHVPVIPGTEYAYSAIDAVVHALVDVQAVSQHAPQDDSAKEISRNLRYIWIPDADPLAAGTAGLVVNAVLNRAGDVVPPEFVPDPKRPTLVRIRLDELTPSHEERDRLAELWDKMAAGDTTFYVKKQILKQVPEYRHTDGKLYRAKYVDVAAFSHHVEGVLGVNLQTLTESTAPVVSLQHFVLTSFNTLRGGLYYDFTGIRGKSLEEFAKDRGVDLNAIQKLQAAHRAALFVSKVTNKPRGIFEQNGPFGTFVYTQDVNEGNAGDPIKNATKTLLRAKFDAVEAIALNKRGLCDFAIFDSAGKLQDVVPPDVAIDEHAPFPANRELQPGYSCYVCHGKFSSDGFRHTKNEILDALSPKTVSKTSSEKIVFPAVLAASREELDELRATYRNDLNRLWVARKQYSGAVFQASRGYTIAQTAEELERIRATYGGRPITPEQACLELGFRIVGDKAKDKGAKKNLKDNSKIAVQVLNAYIPSEEGVIEDPALLGLKRGYSVAVRSWRDAFPDAALAVRNSIDRFRKQEQAKPQTKPPKGAKTP